MFCSPQPSTDCPSKGIPTAPSTFFCVQSQCMNTSAPYCQQVSRTQTGWSTASQNTPKQNKKNPSPQNNQEKRKPKQNKKKLPPTQTRVVSQMQSFSVGMEQSSFLYCVSDAIISKQQSKPFMSGIRIVSRFVIQSLFNLSLTT